MVINKVLNHNAVIVEIDNEEKICFGKGIGFSKNKGDLIDPKKINKIFVLEKSKNYNYESVIQNIPYEYIELSKQLVEIAKKELKKDFCDLLILTLADHIHGSILRLKDPKIRKIANPFLNDLIVFYEKEFKVAKKINDLISQYEDIKFSDNEIGFIALHIINFQNELFCHDEKFDLVVSQIIKIVELSHKFLVDELSFDYSRFITHLKYFALRVLKKERLNISNQKDQDDLFDFVKTNYSKAFETAIKIKDFLSSQYLYEIDNNEVTYLTIHIKRLLDTL